MCACLRVGYVMPSIFFFQEVKKLMGNHKLRSLRLLLLCGEGKPFLGDPEKKNGSCNFGGGRCWEEIRWAVAARAQWHFRRNPSSVS